MAYWFLPSSQRQIQRIIKNAHGGCRQPESSLEHIQRAIEVLTGAALATLLHIFNACRQNCKDQGVYLVTVLCGIAWNTNIVCLLGGSYMKISTNWHDMSTFFRDTVMMLLALLDPDGTSQRCSRKLKRRIYRSKVNQNMQVVVVNIILYKPIFTCRGQTLPGIVMAMINWNRMASQFMDALMG